jgi:bifunctional non-homologous end joining protein LigD
LGELFGNLLVRAHPDVATMERTKDKRGTKVYVDTGQTGPTRTIVCPYSVRATPLATVSMPLPWKDVVPDLDPRAFTIRTVPDYVRVHGDSMAAMPSVKVDLVETMRRIEHLV